MRAYLSFSTFSFTICSIFFLCSTNSLGSSGLLSSLICCRCYLIFSISFSSCSFPLLSYSKKRGVFDPLTTYSPWARLLLLISSCACFSESSLSFLIFEMLSCILLRLSSISCFSFSLCISMLTLTSSVSAYSFTS